VGGFAVVMDFRGCVGTRERTADPLHFLPGYSHTLSTFQYRRLEKIKFRMSSVVVSPVSESR
jgi:hypothetical protein